MDADELTVTHFFGPHFAALPYELREMIVGDVVKSDKAINLRDLDKTIDSLISPFKDVPELRLMAAKQALQTNTFELIADQMIVRNPNNPIYLWASTGQKLRISQDIRHLQVTLQIVVKGGCWNKMYTMPIDHTHQKLLQTVSCVFPRLESLTFFIINHQKRNKYVAYFEDGRRCSEDNFSFHVDLERRRRLMDLVYAFDDLELPLWNRHKGRPQKTIVSSQTIDNMSTACKELEMRKDDSDPYGDNGLAGFVVRTIGDEAFSGDMDCFDWMNEWCDWPMVRMTNVYE